MLMTDDTNRDPAVLKAAYDDLQAALAHYWALMRKATAGEPYEPEELMEAAKGVEASHRNFMVAGEPFMRWGKR